MMGFVDDDKAEMCRMNIGTAREGLLRCCTLPCDSEGEGAGAGETSDPFMLPQFVNQLRIALIPLRPQIPPEVAALPGAPPPEIVPRKCVQPTAWRSLLIGFPRS